MSDETLLLIFRLIAGVSLLGFMGSVAYFLQRDYQLAAQNARARLQVRGRLVVIASEATAPAEGTIFTLTASTTIGRALTNSICIDDSYASQEHARVVWRLGQWWLEDQKSSNGTQLNGLRVDEPVVLSAGDMIGIGTALLRLELD